MNSFFTIDLNVELIQPMVAEFAVQAETILFTSKQYPFDGVDLDDKFITDVNANVDILLNSLKKFDDAVVKHKVVNDGSDLFDDGEQCKIMLIRQDALDDAQEDLDEIVENAMITVSIWQSN